LTEKRKKTLVGLKKKTSKGKSVKKTSGASRLSGSEKGVAELRETILRTSMDGFWITDVEGRFLEVNDAYCHLLGYTREELLQMRVRDIEAVETPEDVARHIGRTIQQGYDRFETRHRRKDGTVVDIEISVNYSDYEGGRFFVFARDISHRKKTEEEIQKLASFPAENPNPVLRIARDGTILYCNAASHALLSSMNCEIGKPAPADWCQAVEEVFDSGTKKEVEKTYGEQTYLFLLVPITDGGYVTIYGRDVTERKKAEGSLRVAKEEWERTFDSIPDLIAILDAKHRIVRANKSMAQRLGMNLSQCVGLNCFRCMHKLDEPPSFCPHALTLADGKEHTAEIHEDNLHGDFIVSTTPLFDQQGQIIGSIHVARDITERKKAEEALREAHDELEMRVDERTKELREATEKLQVEIAERKHAEENVKTERKRFLDLLEALPAYLVLLTPDYHVTYANRFFRERFGEDRDRHCFEYLFGRTEPCETCETYKALETMAPLEWEWTGPDGRNYYIYDHPFTDSDGSTLIMEVGIDITERKKAEEALRKAHNELEIRVEERTKELRESQLDLNRAQTVAKTGSWRLNVQRDELLWSDETYRMFGLPKGTPLTYETFLSIVHPDDKEYVDQKWRAAMKGEPYEIEHRIVVDGEVKWVREKAELEFNEDGSLRGGFGTVQEITERKKAEESLRLSEEKYRTLFDSMTEGFALYKVVYDEKGKPQDLLVLDINPAGEKISGVKREEQVGKTWRQVWSETEQYWYDTYGKVDQTGEPIRYQNYSAITGRWYDNYIFKPSKDYVAVIFSDITESKQLQDRLFQSERKYRTLYETSLDGILSVDMDGHITECNDACVHMLGYSKDELKNMTYQQLTPEKWRKMDEEIVREQIIKRGYSDLYEKEYIRKDGSVFPINLRAWLVRDEKWRPIAMWGIVRDITKSKQLESELKRYSEHLEQLVEERTRKLKNAERLAAIGETAAMVGHDIRNPLQTIEGAVYLAKEEIKALPSRTEEINNIDEMLSTIREETVYVDKIVSDLQDYTRPLAPRLEETKVQPLLDSILADADVSQNVEVSVTVEQDCCTITVDPTMMKRILTNLVLNALQAMPNGGKLTIKATKKQEAVLITVQDTGTGISEENKPKIFQPLFSTKAKGQGFGLAVVKRLVEAHKGEITLESEAGKGTTFSILLPAAKEVL